MSDADAATESVRHARTLVGRTLKEKWRLDALVGVGGMASVYAATHRNGDRVAVKVLHPQYAVQPSVRTRFLREGYAANAVGHAGAVNVRDDETDGDIVFLVMELLEGETLDARWERMGTLPLGEVCSIGEQMLDVLASAHDKGIWHRDIKPGNVFLTVDGRVKLLDFGIAKVRDASGGGDASVTQTGAMVGTPAFMSPEQVMAASKQIDAQSDLWAVGATLFSLLTGRYVHHASTPNELLVKTATEPPPSLRTVWRDAPECVVAVIDKALARDKSQRWSDARTMRAALQAARESLGLALDVPRSSAPPTQREAAAFAETVGSDPNRVESRHTPSQLGNLTTAHDVASSVSVRVPAALSGGKSKKRWLAAALAVTLLGGVAIGVTLVVRTGQTAPAAAASDPVEPAPPPPATVAPVAPPATAEPRVEPSPTPPPAAADAGAVAAKPPVRTQAPPVRRVEPKTPPAAPPSSAAGRSIPWDVR